MTALSSDTKLQGFGVFLDIKNMEYKNVDDANPSAGDAAGSQSSKTNEDKELFPEGEEIAGNENND